MRWPAARMGEMTNVYNALVGKLKGGFYSGDLGVDGKIILERILGTNNGKLWVGCIWLPVLSSGRKTHEKQKSNCFDYNQNLVMEPGRAQSQDGLTD